MIKGSLGVFFCPAVGCVCQYEFVYSVFGLIDLLCGLKMYCLWDGVYILYV